MEEYTGAVRRSIEWMDNTCEVIRQETVLFSTPETYYIIYD